MQTDVKQHKHEISPNTNTNKNKNTNTNKNTNKNNDPCLSYACRSREQFRHTNNNNINKSFTHIDNNLNRYKKYDLDMNRFWFCRITIGAILAGQPELDFH